MDGHRDSVCHQTGQTGEQIFKHTTVQSKWFNSPANTFLGIANTPDIVNISQNGKKVTLFEVSCAFDLFMEDSYCSKILKYQSLISTVENLGYKCQFIVQVFGSLGHVHSLAIRGLCIGGLSKTRFKQLAKYCSISATIGSRAVTICDMKPKSRHSDPRSCVAV